MMLNIFSSAYWLYAYLRRNICSNPLFILIGLSFIVDCKSSLYILFKIFIYLPLAVLGLCCCVGFSLVSASALLFSATL